MTDRLSRRTLPDGLTVRRPTPIHASVAQLQDWDNEGGSFVADNEAGLLRDRQRLSLASLPEDTVAGCRARADADLARASAGSAGPGRWRYEHSAASWIRRAEMLERLLARRGAAIQPAIAMPAPDVGTGAAGDPAGRLTLLHAERFASGDFHRRGKYAHHARVLRQSLARLAPGG